MDTWFSADTHFGHANTIRYSNRPFLRDGDLDSKKNWISWEIAKQRVTEMNEIIIDNFNKRIKDDDNVYFLGDFCFRNSVGGKKGEGEIYKAKYYQEKLKGKWVYIRGNHDKSNSLKTPIEYLVIKFGGYRMKLVHNPIHADPSFMINLCGHVHQNWVFKKIADDSYCINVGVDVWNFMPIGLDEILKRFNKWKKNEGKRIKTS